VNSHSPADMPPQERMLQMGRMLDELGARPDVLAQLQAALTGWDQKRFRDVLDPFVGGPPVPPDLCDPYVRVIVAILKPPKFVRQCMWVHRRLTAGEREEIAIATAKPANADRLLATLEKLGLVKCSWVPVDQTQYVEVDKFVQGVCPWGTF
jgi:hypothetical protein